MRRLLAILLVTAAAVSTAQAAPVAEALREQA